MSSIFDKYQDIGPDVKHSNFPVGQSNFTSLPFGKVVPFYGQYVCPNTHVKIDNPSAQFTTLPMAWRVLNRLRLHVQYYYCRDRQIFDHYMDFMTQTGEFQPGQQTDEYPYLAFTPEQQKKMFGVGGIADRFGLPVVAPCGLRNQSLGASKNDNGFIASCSGLSSGVAVYGRLSRPFLTSNSVTELLAKSPSILDLVQPLNILTPVGFNDYLTRRCTFYNMNGEQAVYQYIKDLPSKNMTCCPVSLHYLPIPVTLTADSALLNYNENLCAYEFFNNFKLSKGSANRYSFSLNTCSSSVNKTTPDDESEVSMRYVAFFDENDKFVTYGELKYNKDGYYTLKSLDSEKVDGLKVKSFAILYTNIYTPVNAFTLRLYSPRDSDLKDFSQDSWKKFYPHVYVTVLGASQLVTDMKNDDCFYNPKNHRLPVNLFRHYDRIYNAYLRNSKNNPLKINGRKEYNKYNITTAGGADETVYTLKPAPWMHDMFTTGIQSPTGDIPSPLVPVESRPAEVVVTDDNGSPILKAKTALHHDDMSFDDLEITEYRSDKDAFDAIDAFEPLKRNWWEFEQAGINIQTLTDLTSLERFLEFRFRNGLHYPEFIKGQFGVHIHFKDMLIPEFIGGYTEDIQVNSVVNQTLSPDSPLGELGGFGSTRAEGRSFSHFCDEEGYIVGIAWVDCAPVYADALPPAFDLNEYYKFYKPEFGNISMQPIPNKMLAPLVAYAEGGKAKCDEPFAYQMAWWWMRGAFSFVSGDLSAELADFVLARHFGSTPQLGAQFTTIASEDLNNIFVDTSEKDKLIGAFVTPTVLKEPLPLVGLPEIR